MCGIVLSLQPGAAAVGVHWESVPLLALGLAKAGQRKQIGHMASWALSSAGSIENYRQTAYRVPHGLSWSL